MAVDRVLTSDEKISLLNDTRFQSLARLATFTNSAMWAVDDGSTYVTEATRIAWAKSRIRGRAVLIDPTTLSVTVIAPQFIIFLAAINLWDSAISPWAPGAFTIGQNRTYGGKIWNRLTNGSDTFLTPPVEGVDWTQTGWVNATILDYMVANSTFVTLAASWMTEQVFGINM